MTQDSGDLERKSKGILKEDFDKKSTIEDTYTVIDSRFDKRFGDIHIMQNNVKNLNLLVTKEKISHSESEAAMEIAFTKDRLGLDHVFLQKLYDFSSMVKKNFCSTMYKVKTYYEYPFSDLDQEIQEKRANEGSFTSEQLTFIAYDILSVLDYLHSMSLAYGDLRPEYISFSEDGKTFKLLDRLNDPSDSLTANRNHNMAGKALYCSPQLYFDIKKRATQSFHDRSKSDCWSLGLCLLEAATLDKVNDIYLPDGNINRVKLRKIMDKMDSIYREENGLICDLIRGLLAVDEDQRLNSEEFLSFIPPYNVLVEAFSSENANRQLLTLSKENSYLESPKGKINQPHNSEHVQRVNTEPISDEGIDFTGS